MTYELMTGAINLDELEVQAEEVTEASADLFSAKMWVMTHDAYWAMLCW